jgi:hypothetical protein
MSRLSSVLSPFLKNKNTGNLYEIATALTLLRRMGVSDAEFDADVALLEAIAVYNDKKTTELRTLFAAVRAMPLGTGLVFDGHTIVRLECVTQDDGAGRTGDLLLHTSTGASLSLSVCEGKPKRGGVIEKCLSNPSAKRFGCTAADLTQFDAIQGRAVTAYKADMTAKHGADESAWPSRVRTSIATDACGEVAAVVASRFASLETSKQRAIVDDLLRIEEGKKPADYLALVDKKTLIPRFYRFDLPTATATATAWAPTLVAEGIWLHVENAGKRIGSTQVKFNNGVYHKGKTSSLHTSWNATFCLTELFTMAPVTFV